ncbi:MAG: hypothetical protein M3362_11830 [Acidobacteriota bacterium]|nr:hypothetical protein [Acidobacteriota bacterium]
MAEKVPAAQLDALLNQTGKSIQIREEEVTVRPFRVKQLSGVFRAIEQLRVYGLSDQGFSIAQMLMLGGLDAIAEVISIATGKSREWVDDLMPDEAALLGRLVWEVDADFFKRQSGQLKEALGPLWVILEGRAKALGLMTTGPAQSSDSSAQVTGSQTSQITHSNKSDSSANQS